MVVVDIRATDIVEKVSAPQGLYSNWQNERFAAKLFLNDFLLQEASVACNITDLTTAELKKEQQSYYFRSL